MHGLIRTKAFADYHIFEKQFIITIIIIIIIIIISVNVILVAGNDYIKRKILKYILQKLICVIPCKVCASVPPSHLWREQGGVPSSSYVIWGDK
jgi:hypothetical protein